MPSSSSPIRRTPTAAAGSSRPSSSPIRKTKSKKGAAGSSHPSSHTEKRAQGLKILSALTALTALEEEVRSPRVKVRGHYYSGAEVKYAMKRLEKRGRMLEGEGEELRRSNADLTNQLAEQTESANQFRQWRDEWRDECERERREAFEQQHRVRVSREEERVEFRANIADLKARNATLEERITALENRNNDLETDLRDYDRAANEFDECGLAPWFMDGGEEGRFVVSPVSDMPACEEARQRVVEKCAAGTWVLDGKKHPGLKGRRWTLDHADHEEARRERHEHKMAERKRALTGLGLTGRGGWDWLIGC